MADLGCYKCPDRKAHCHSTCEKHIERTERHRAEQDEIRARKDKEREIESVSIAGRIKALKRRDNWREKER
jgi:hypothetical protein